MCWAMLKRGGVWDGGGGAVCGGVALPFEPPKTIWNN